MYYLIYDSECALCTRFKDGLSYLAPDSDLTYLSLHSEQTYEQFPQLDPSQCKDNIHLINTAGEVWVGADVIVELSHHIPKISKLAWLLESQAGRKAANIFYDKVNQLKKSRLNRCKSCS